MKLFGTLLGLAILVWILGQEVAPNPYWMVVCTFPLIWFGYRAFITLRFARKNKETMEMIDRELKKGTFDND